MDQRLNEAIDEWKVESLETRMHEFSEFVKYSFEKQGKNIKARTVLVGEAINQAELIVHQQSEIKAEEIAHRE